MAIAVALQKYSPAVNPDTAILKLTFSGSYVALGDALDLTPSKWTDPNNVGILGYPTTLPKINPAVLSQVFAAAQQGYYCAVLQGTALNNYKFQINTAGGSELGAGAYPAGILAGEVFIEISV